MPITNSTPQPKDIVIIQRSNDGQSYGEVHISGSGLILHVDSQGYINADISSSFYSIYPPPSNAGLVVGGSYMITASWAVSSSWAPSAGGGGTTLYTASLYQITSSQSVTASNSITSSKVTELSTGTGYLVRQVSPDIGYGDQSIRAFGTGFEVFDFTGDTQLLNTNNAILTFTSTPILSTATANRVLVTDAASQIISSGITDVQLNDLPNKYSSGSAMTASGVSSAGPLKVMMPQPDSVVQWPAAKSESYGRFLFSQGNTEFGTLQVLGSGFDQFYSTSGRSNAMEFYNNYGPIVFFNRGSERMRVAASGSIIVNRPGITSSLNTLEVNGTISCSVITASLFNGTASYASQALSASWAPSVGGPGGGTTLFTASTYQITSSYASTSSLVIGYTDRRQYVDSSWEFFAQGNTTAVYDGWNLVNGTVTVINSELNHPGVIRRNSATTVGASSYFTPSIIGTGMLIAIGNFRSLEFILRPAVSIAGDYNMRFGISSDLTTISPASGYFFERTGSAGSITGSWQLSSYSASLLQTTGSGVPFAMASASDWHNFKLIRDNNTNIMSYYIDDVFYATSSFTFQPSTTFVFGLQIWAIGSPAQRSFDLDFCRLTSYPLAR